VKRDSLPGSGNREREGTHQKRKRGGWRRSVVVEVNEVDGYSMYMESESGTYMRWLGGEENGLERWIGSDYSLHHHGYLTTTEPFSINGPKGYMDEEGKRGVDWVPLV
jgi:hypothetical protein